MLLRRRWVERLRDPHLQESSLLFRSAVERALAGPMAIGRPQSRGWHLGMALHCLGHATYRSWSAASDAMQGMAKHSEEASPSAILEQSTAVLGMWAAYWLKLEEGSSGQLLFVCAPPWRPKNGHLDRFRISRTIPL